MDFLFSTIGQIIVVFGSFIAIFGADQLSRNEKGESNHRLRDRIVYLILLGGLIGFVAANLLR